MGRNCRCFVPNCDSGYVNNSEKVSLFKAPKDKTFREIWEKIIQRADRILKENDVICEKHFEPDAIIRSYDIGNVGVIV